MNSLIDDQLKFQEGTKFGKELIDQASIKAKKLVVKNFGGNLEKANNLLTKIQVPFSKVQRNFTSEIIFLIDLLLTILPCWVGYVQ